MSGSIKVKYNVSKDTPKRSQKEHYPHKTDSSIFESGDSNSKDFSCDSSFRKHPVTETESNKLANEGDATADESPKQEVVGSQSASGYVSKPAARLEANYEEPHEHSQRAHYSHKIDSLIFESGDSNSKDFTCDSSFRKLAVTETESKNEGDATANESPKQGDVGSQTASGCVSKPAAGLETDYKEPHEHSRRGHYSHKTDSSIFASGNSNSKDFTCDSSFRKHSVKETESNDGDAAANELPKQEDVGSQTAPSYVSKPAAGLETDYEETHKRSQRGHYSHRTDSSIFESGDSNSKDFTCDSSFRKHSVTETESNKLVNEDDATANESPNQGDIDSQAAPSKSAAGLQTDDEEPPKRSQRRHYSHKTDSSIFESGDSNSKDFTCNSSFRKQ